MLRSAANVLLALTLVVGSVSPSYAAGGSDGTFYFRSGAQLISSGIQDPGSNYETDITARFVGVVGFDLAEKIPPIAGKTVQRWEIIDGAVPAGVVFNDADGAFSGVPTREQTALVAYARGFDGAGDPIALAEVKFDVFQPGDQYQKVDFYGHTGRYNFEQLPVPAGMTVDHWNLIFAPPPGVAVLGKNFDGTPTKAGRYPVVVQGFDYLDRELILLAGYYLVDDGPVFAKISDDVRPVDPQSGFQSFNLSPPPVRSVGDGPSKVVYSAELVEGASFPGTIISAPPSGRISGNVYYPYQTAKVRFKAVDVDGATGHSNWFDIGTSFPSPMFSSSALGPFAGSVGQPFSVGFATLGTAGTKTFTLAAGTLPQGLALDASTGMISGSPTNSEEQNDIQLHLAVRNGSAVDETTSVPFSIKISPESVDLEITSVSGDSAFGKAAASKLSVIHARIGEPVSAKVSAVGDVIQPVAITVDPANPLPSGVNFNSSTGILSGSPTGIGKSVSRFVLTNGDGRRKDASLQIAGFSPLTVNDAADVTIGRYELGKPVAQLSYDAAGVIPFSDGAIKPEVEITGSLPDGISFDPVSEQLVGGPKVPEGRYGPYAFTIRDGRGGAATTNSFFITVTPRKTISVESRNVSFLYRTEGVAAPISNVTRPALSNGLKLTYSIVAGSIPAEMTLNADTGIITGKADQTGTYPGIRIRVVDSEGFGATSEPFTLEVLPPGPLLASYIAPVIVPVGVPATFPSAKFTNVVGSISFISATGLPAGLDFDEVSGVVSGTPTETTNNAKVEILASDEDGRTITARFDMTVIPQPTVDFGGVAMPIVTSLNETKSVDLVAHNVIGAVSYELRRGTLPPGFRFFVTGRISGTATKEGTYGGLVVRATDTTTGLFVDTAPFQINVGPRKALEFSYASPYNVYEMLGARLPIVPTLNNAHGTTKFAMTAGTLPAGLKFEPSNGRFTGVPTATGLFSGITVTATDADGFTSTAMFDIFSSRFGSIEGTSVVKLGYRSGQSFSTGNLGYTNFVAPLVYESKSLLPNSLVLNPQTGSISGTITDAGEYAFPVNAMDAHGRSRTDGDTSLALSIKGSLAVSSQPSSVTTTQYSAQETVISAGFANLIGTPTYTLTGQLPAGTKFDPATGTISGKPSAVGTFSNLKITAKDGYDNTTVATNAFSITVGARLPLTAKLPAEATTLANYDIAAIAAVNVANPAYGAAVTYSMTGTLPSGVTFDTKTGTFKGNATQIGDYPNIFVTVTDSVGATSKAGPMTIKARTDGNPITLAVGDIVTKVGFPFVTPEPVTSNQVGTKRFYSYDLVPEINLNSKTGTMSGVFSGVRDFEFSISVGDETNRTSSDRLQVVVYPPMRIVTPLLTRTTQYSPVTTPVQSDVAYVVGTKSFVQGNPTAWPDGLTVNASTGAISGTPVKSGVFRNLTIIGTDNLNGALDVQTSNPFTIEVQKANIVPKIAVANSSYISDVGAILNIVPVVTDSVFNKPWTYAGLKYTLTGTLPLGSTFNPTTGAIAYRSYVAETFADFMIQVEDADGNKASTPVFKIGARPTANMALAMAVPGTQNKSARPGVVATYPASVVSNAVGTVTYAVTSSNATEATVDTAGVLKAKSSTVATVVVTATDGLGRKAVLSYNLAMLPAVTATQAPIFVLAQSAYTSGIAPVPTNAIGPVTYLYEGLPSGMTFNGTTGIISGTPSVIGSFTVTLKATDSDSTGPASSFVVKVLDSTPHRYWRIVGQPTWWGSGYLGSVGFFDAAGTNVALRVAQGTATAAASGFDKAWETASQIFVQNTSQTIVANATSGGLIWAFVDFGPAPVSLTKMTFSSCPGQVYIQAVRLDYSDDGTTWVAATPMTGNSNCGLSTLQRTQ